MQHEPVATQQATSPRPRSPSEQGLPRHHGGGWSSSPWRASRPSATSSRSPPRRRRWTRSSRASSARPRRCGPPTARAWASSSPTSCAAPWTARTSPRSLKDATVAIEDERYYHHKGVDYAGVVRAALKNLSSHKTVQGGSTITMQLVRNLYITKERTYQRKIREAKLAEELENEHTKAVDPRQVPQHRALRHARRPDRGRRPGGRARVLREARREAQAPRGRAARRPAAGAEHLLAGARPREGRGAPQRGAREDGPAQDDHAGDGERGEARARRQALALLHEPPRVVLLRLRQGRADQGVRRQDRAPGRPARRHDDRPQEAGRPRARRSTAAWPASGPRRRS